MSRARPRINDQITLKFVVDSGASDVSIPADVVMTLLRTGTISDSDFLGTQKYRMADGSTVPSQQFVIRSLKVGDRTLENVTGSIAPMEGGLLLGQSFLRRSANFRPSGERAQDNQIVVIRDAATAAKFDAHFERTWDAAQPMDEFALLRRCAQRTASTTLRSSMIAPSPARLTTRPPWASIVGLKSPLRSARRRASVASSLTPISRL